MKKLFTPPLLRPNDNRTTWHREEVTWLLSVLRAVATEEAEFPPGSMENFTALNPVRQAVAAYEKKTHIQKMKQ